MIDPEVLLKLNTVLTWLILAANVQIAWLIHTRIPLKKKPGRKKKSVSPPTGPDLPVKRHTARTAEEMQPRE